MKFLICLWFYFTATILQLMNFAEAHRSSLLIRTTVTVLDSPSLLPLFPSSLKTIGQFHPTPPFTFLPAQKFFCIKCKFIDLVLSVYQQATCLIPLIH